MTKLVEKNRNIIVGIIPARFGSTRLPGKPLIDIDGKPMIQRVYEQAKKSKLLDKVFVATDDKRIFNCVINFGGEAVMTSKKHKTGTDRIYEAVNKLKADIIVNIQGDEPFISPSNIDNAIIPLIEDKKLNVSTLAIKTKKFNNPNIVKVVFDKNNFAIYFSRYAVPFNRENRKIRYYKHIGLYVYRKDFLLKFAKMKQTPLEIAEKLEQLRILENGEKIKVIITNKDSASIDTLEDIKNIGII
jgi:3-deoxy-manno-octulosonate cytidylyltransferase (CMP-KDO synthetase)